MFISLFLHGLDVDLPEHDGAHFLIYLTNWTFILYTFHSLWAALSVTATYSITFVFKRNTATRDDHELGGPCNHEFLISERPQGCCGYTSDKTKWYQKIQWLLSSIATFMVIGVCIFYWPLVYKPNESYLNYGNIVGHGILCFIGLVDIYITGIPWRILHFIYTMIFSAIYIFFTVIYYLAGGMNGEGQRYIYSSLDYENHPMTAAVSAVLIVFVVLPIGHFCLYCLYLTRELLLYLVQRFCRSCNKHRDRDQNGVKREILNQEPYSP